MKNYKKSSKVKKSINIIYAQAICFCLLAVAAYRIVGWGSTFIRGNDVAFSEVQSDHTMTVSVAEVYPEENSESVKYQGSISQDAEAGEANTDPIPSNIMADNQSELTAEVNFKDFDPDAVVHTTARYGNDGSIQESDALAVDNASQQYQSNPIGAESRPRLAYTNEQLDYLLEVAIGTEFGDASNSIKKWIENVYIKVYGSTTLEDMQTLQKVVSELNELIDPIEITIVSDTQTDQKSNIDIYFVPEKEFAQYEPNYRPLNYGFFWVWWRDHVIYRSRIMISTEGVTQVERSHLIREELTQSLGLMIDSSLYPDSIFFEGWTQTLEYAPIDRLLIEMLYQPEIMPGMTITTVIERLKAL